MKSIEISFPLLGLIAGTRGMLGAGAGMLVGEKLTREQRRAVGWTLIAVGAITTLPLVAQVLSSARKSHAEPKGRFQSGAGRETEAAMANM